MIFNGMNELLYLKKTIESHLNYGKWLTYALNIKKMVRIKYQNGLKSLFFVLHPYVTQKYNE